MISLPWTDFDVARGVVNAKIGSALDTGTHRVGTGNARVACHVTCGELITRPIMEVLKQEEYDTTIYHKLHCCLFHKTFCPSFLVYKKMNEETLTSVNVDSTCSRMFSPWLGGFC